MFQDFSTSFYLNLTLCKIFLKKNPQLKSFVKHKVKKMLRLVFSKVVLKMFSSPMLLGQNLNFLIFFNVLLNEFYLIITYLLDARISLYLSTRFPLNFSVKL